MEQSHILDYNFTKDERAQYVYVDDAGEEKRLVVRIVTWDTFQDGKLYIISAHKEKLGEVGLAVNNALSGYYQADLAPEHAVAIVDPDELEPAYRQLNFIVDNTRSKNDQNDETRR